MKRVVAVVVGLALSYSAVAFAGWKEQQEAQKLAREAKGLAQKKEFKDAAKKYKKADGLSPAPSYKLALGQMLIELEDLMQARDVLRECKESDAKQWNEKTAAKGCTKLAGELDERIPTLKVRERAPKISLVRVTVDDEEFDPTDGEVELNPGTHDVVAVAKGYERWVKRVKLDEGDEKSVSIEMIKTGGPEEEGEGDDSGGGLSPVPAYVSWAVGAVGLGLGVGFGVVAIDTTNEVLILYNCENGACPKEAEDDLNNAKTNGNISTAGFVVGLAGLATGTVLYFLSDDDPPKGDTAVAPLVAPGFVGVTGTF